MKEYQDGKLKNQGGRFKKSRWLLEVRSMNTYHHMKGQISRQLYSLLILTLYQVSQILLCVNQLQVTMLISQSWPC